MTSKKKKIIWFFIIVLGLLVIVRVILPYVVLHYLNKTLATMEGYYGHADDIDIALIRGAYTIDSIYLNKLDSTTDKQTPFFGASEIDLSVEWKALFHGSIVGELVFEDAMLRFTKYKVEPKEVRSDSSSFKNLLDDFMPLQVNRVEINNGSIQYKDETSKPPVDIQLSNAYLLAQNLRNSYDSSVVLPASLTAHANIYEGELALNVKLNPLADDPTFDMNAEVKNTNLVKLNDFFKAYAKIDVNKGRFGLYTEVAAKEGKFAGYVKPLIQDLDVLGKEDRKDNILRKMWEGLAGTVGEVFENQRKDQVATKVPFEGNLKNPDTNVWYALSSILQNAFIRAIQPSIDQEINIATVDTQKEEKKNILQKIFGKKDDKDKDKDKNKEEEKEKEKKKDSDKKDDDKDKKN
ncbi:DUF748 domain-containing protein [Ohtaekwangia koreensis]|uniref:DUF748 domain-containing protein n=1 Tax=Ohtaekwangia koreensis TaxID=688867 RepID=A0A1T5JT34_9BACT|nr:DUF748 domain-containing protein [Ohtaekwangia koreensis]SKC54642.1 protein of unknown function [Ohtaekwangia koreensis]